MSDIAPRSLCSCQLGQCSGYLCECRPRRSLCEALVDVGEARKLNLRQTAALVATARTAEVIVLAERRRVS